MSTPIPTFPALLDGYGKTVEHALSLASASADVSKSQVGTRLALAELAQEELGKSFSILSAFSLPPEDQAWKQFWKEFRDHDLKSARAFFYEWFEPMRWSIVLEDGSTPDGTSRFKRMSHEKSYGFYVDYDKSVDRFFAPSESVRPADADERMLCVLSLAQKAFALHTVLTDEDVEFSVREWSRLAMRLCTRLTYQQEMMGVLDEFAAQSERHRRLRERVEEGMRLTAIALKKLDKKLALNNNA